MIEIRNNRFLIKNLLNYKYGLLFAGLTIENFNSFLHCYYLNHNVIISKDLKNLWT